MQEINQKVKKIEERHVEEGKYVDHPLLLLKLMLPLNRFIKAK